MPRVIVGRAGTLLAAAAAVVLWSGHGRGIDMCFLPAECVQRTCEYVRPVPESVPVKEGNTPPDTVCVGYASENIGLCTTFPWTPGNATCRLPANNYACRLTVWERLVQETAGEEYWFYQAVYDADFNPVPCDYQLGNCAGSCN